jgi:membrane-associated phospholipid phosphatase
VGALRVAAAKHFPSDVLAGAVLGSGVALAVHHIRF